MKIGILREEKQPYDLRTPFTPEQCQQIQQQFPSVSFVVQPSAHRCFSEEAYKEKGIQIAEDLSSCDYLFGIKEVPVKFLQKNATYLIFSHTFKEQPYNRDKLVHCLQQNIRLIDYELLKNNQNKRIVGFGRYAGIVGAHNGLLVYGKKMNAYQLKRALECKDYEELLTQYELVHLPPIKVIGTGGGRVGKGIEELLTDVGITRVDKTSFIKNSFDYPVFTMLNSEDIYVHKETGSYDQKHFRAFPEQYSCAFKDFFTSADLMVNGIYWDPNAAVFFSKDEMRLPNFNIKVVADVSCDVEGSIPATLQATNTEVIAYGYDVYSEKIVPPYEANTIDIMSITNLPTELPVDASRLFGHQLSEMVIPELLKTESIIIEKATICENGRLTATFEYLQNYVAGTSS